MARFGSAVVVADTSGDQETFINALLAALDPANIEAAGLSPADLAWQLAELLGSQRGTAPAFGVAITISGGYLLLLHGAVRALVSGADGEVKLTGRSALTWVDKVVSEPVNSISITLAENGTVDADPRSDLRGGVVSGGGLILTPATSEPRDKPAVAMIKVTAPVAAVTELSPEPAPEPAPELSPEPATGVVPVLAAPVQVPAPPPAVDPATTVDLPTPPNRRTSVDETAAVEPVDAALVSDEGAITPLDRSYVLGRNPHSDESVARGTASPVVVKDPDNLISRVQAYVLVGPDGVTVRDASSSNGTYLAAPGATDWVRLGNEPAPLPVGWSIRMGRRVFTHLAKS